MALNNNLLFNAALSGFLAGALATSNQTDLVALNANPPTVPAPADYAALVAMGVLFATAVDTAISGDVAATPQPAGTGPISVGSPGVAIAPTTGPILEAQTFKIQMMQMLCFGVSFGRYPSQPSDMTNAQFQAQYAANITAIKNIYFEAAVSAVTT